jgi:hypothetical protein
MSTLLVATRVFPGFRQIAVSDFGTASYPEWEGGEALVWVPTCFAIGTNEDTYGDVLVELRVGAVDVPGVREIHSGTFTCPSGRVSVTGPTDEREVTLTLPRTGDWRIRIAVRGEKRPDYVGIFFDAEEWSAVTP